MVSYILTMDKRSAVREIALERKRAVARPDQWPAIGGRSTEMRCMRHRRQNDPHWRCYCFSTSA